jgi:hypothetical protein
MKEQKVNLSNMYMVSILALIAIVQVFRLSELSFMRASLFTYEISFVIVIIPFVLIISFLFFYLPVVFTISVHYRLPYSYNGLTYKNTKQLNIRLNNKTLDRTYLRLCVIRC